MFFGNWLSESLPFIPTMPITTKFLRGEKRALKKGKANSLMGVLQGELKRYILPGERPLDSLQTSVPGDRVSGNLSGTRWSTPTLAPWQDVVFQGQRPACSKSPSAEDRLQTCGVTAGTCSLAQRRKGQALPFPGFCEMTFTEVASAWHLWNLFSQAGHTWKGSLFLYRSLSL